METLPPEIYDMILPRVGGLGFISLRQTCKRLKTLADKIEMTLKPSIWYRYTYEDFSQWCIESVVPWLKENKWKIDKDSTIWKTVYSCLFQSKIKKNGLTCKKIVLACALSNVENMFFAGQQLILYRGSAICLGMANDFEQKKTMPITGLRHMNADCHIPLAYEKLLPYPSNNNNIVYRPLNVADESVVKCCREMVSTMVSRYLKVPPIEDSCLGESVELRAAYEKIHNYAHGMGFFLQWEVEIYESGILMMVAGDKMVFCHHFTKNSRESTEYMCSNEVLPFFGIRCVLRLQNLLIMTCATDQTMMCEMQFAKNGRITLGEWRALGLDNIGADGGLTDFDIVGQSFIGVTKIGKVFISNLEECSYEHIQKNLFLATELPFKEHSYYYKICLDISDGLNIAILDTSQNLTMLFIN